MRTLAIRADADTQIGIGHVMRCLALAQAWQDAGEHAIFMMGLEAPAIEARLRSEGMEVVHLSVQPGSADDATQTANLARKMGAPWVVVDGYNFGADYHRIIKDSDLLLLFIDDNGHLEHYCADIVLNQNLHAHEGLYEKREPYTRLLLGTQYALLRREFLKWRGWKREIPEVGRKVLVTLGGSDPDNVTLKVIQALRQVEMEGLEAVVVVGGSNPHYEELQTAIRDSLFPIRLENNVTYIPELMAWADVAVSGGGSTSWELAFIGLPNLILILANNQHSIADGLDTAGVAANLGRYDNLSSAQIAQALTRLLAATMGRAEMARHSQELVDGEGADRVLMQVKSKILSLRQVREDDCRLLWEWANDPEVRAVSFLSEPILWDQHVQWFKSKINDPHSIFYIGINSEEIPIGQIRYDINGNAAVLSISVDRSFRGKGYGSMLIRFSSQKLFDVSDVNMIHAYLKQGNEASLRTFIKEGFREMGSTVIQGHQAIHLVLQKGELI